MREDAGHTTYESLDAAADQLLDAGLDDVVLVTDPYHSLRSRLIAEEVGLDADVSPTPTSVVTGWSSFTRRARRRPGEWPSGRIIGFDRLSESDRLTDRPWRVLTRAVHSSLAPMGCGVTGNTADSGSVIQGSIPCTPTNRPRRLHIARDS